MKRYKLETTDQAAYSLKEIRDFIKDQGAPLTAKRFQEGVRHYIKRKLPNMPHKFKECEEIGMGVRYGQYKNMVYVYYLIDEAARCVKVLDIVHTSRERDNYAHRIRLMAGLTEEPDAQN